LNHLRTTIQLFYFIQHSQDNGGRKFLNSLFIAGFPKKQAVVVVCCALVGGVANTNNPNDETQSPAIGQQGRKKISRRYNLLQAQASSLKRYAKKIMENNFLANLYARELQAEHTATRKCLGKIPDNIYHFKPHPKSMELGYLALLVAEIPLWIVHIIKDGVIDFATYKQFRLSTSEALLQHYEENFKSAVQTLQQVSDEKLEDKFILQNNGQQLMSTSKKESIGSSINHWVHHRGQLTVYMRLNDIPVPSIYGPSADERTF